MVYVTTNDERSNDGRIFPGGFDGLIDGVNEITIDEGPIGKRTSSRKINAGVSGIVGMAGIFLLLLHSHKSLLSF